MLVRDLRRPAALARPRDERLLEQIGFDHVLQRVPLLAHGGGNGVDTDRAAFVDVDQRLEKDRSWSSRPFSSMPASSSAALVMGTVTFPSPSTAAKSRTRRSNRFATRGVPDCAGQFPKGLVIRRQFEKACVSLENLVQCFRA